MGTYFALMEKAAERGEDYQDLGRIKEVLMNIQRGDATPREAVEVLKYLDKLEERVNDLMEQPSPPVQAHEALGRLEDLKFALKAYVNVGRK